MNYSLEQENSTPQELADALYKENIFFPNDQYQSLTQMVKQISFSYHLPY